MKFSFSDNSLIFSGDNFEPKFTENHDFWRLFLDDGEFKEIPVFSHNQTPVVTKENKDGFEIQYNKIVDRFGTEYNIKLTVFGEYDGEVLNLTSKIENNSNATVNEIMLPYISCLELGCKYEDEIYYKPDGLGAKIKNPRAHIQWYAHTEYTSSDYHEVISPIDYPASLSMSWNGIQAGDTFIYFAAHDEEAKTATFTVGTNPRLDPTSRITMAVSHYPHVIPGETVFPGKSCLGLFNGGWRTASKYYRKWSEQTWYKPVERPEWIINMTGWQRVILKHQYGEIFFKYKDLPQLWKNGMECGINTLMVFGWWKGRFDNGYPEYEPDPALGGREELVAAIDEIHRLGGHVHLYTNGSLIDVKTDFYKKIGKDICVKDLDGNERRDHYSFSNEGTILRVFGYKSFVTACHCTDEWQKVSLQLAKLRLDLGADSVFYDQLCVCSKLCFDTNHPHGNRIDADPQGRIDNVLSVREILPEDKAIGSEDVYDRLSTLLDYNHGCTYGMSYDPGAVPELFRETFPECIISNRYIHDEKINWRKQWNYAFAYNLIFDVSMNRGRLVDISGYPETGKYLKEMIDLKEKYKEFFYGGRFRSADDLILEGETYASNYEANGKRITALCNNNDFPVTVDVYGKKVTIEANGYTVSENF